ncbi:hypothetical protein HYH03_017125 [Edaphochlamys debaryana]|uniref:MYND-type domain-containing protein n=1 Tax=Edaphochlamys debaryana TaxID=47281 RepID=A0A835XIJ2_9CHLO|nr:hypothetical protein HYH03_017125 [Edaphochlamys debaryana]|eukprot:KAG2484035.1 hypothetical protein HYH03_017125 [Edaphochlamys debaryana]
MVAPQQQLEKAWLAYMLCADRCANVFVERILWQPSQRDVKLRTRALEDAKRALLDLASLHGLEVTWTGAPKDDGSQAPYQWLAAAQQAGVPAWLLRTLRALPTRAATASTASTAWAVCNAADAACVAADAAATALSLCLAPLAMPRLLADWAHTAPHAAGLLDAPLLTALSQAARVMSDLAQHTARPSTRALVADARSPRPPAPGCAGACAQLALTAAQCLRTGMDLLDKQLGDVNKIDDQLRSLKAGGSGQLLTGSNGQPPEIVVHLAEALRESQLPAGAARAILTCPGPQCLGVAGQIERGAVAVPADLDSSVKYTPAWHFGLVIASYLPRALQLRYGGIQCEAARKAAEALGEAMGHPEVAALRQAMLEGVWEHAGLGPGSEAGYESARSALCELVQGSAVSQTMSRAHGRILSGVMGLWQMVCTQQVTLTGAGAVPPEPGVPPELQLARAVARTAEAQCRLSRGQGLWGAYGPVTRLHAIDQEAFLFSMLDEGLTTPLAAPHWAEAAAWALATAVEALASFGRNSNRKDPAHAVAGGVARMEAVARSLKAAWQRGGAPASTAGAGTEAALAGLRRAGLGASLDHALRLAYAAADRAAAPGASEGDRQAALALGPVPARVVAVVEALGLELLAPAEGPDAGPDGPGLSLGLGLGDAGPLAMTVAKRALGLAVQLEAAEAEAAEAGVVQAGAAAAPPTVAEGAAMPAEQPQDRTPGAEALRHSLAAMHVCVVLLKHQRLRRSPPLYSGGGGSTAAAASSGAGAPSEGAAEGPPSEGTAPSSEAAGPAVPGPGPDATVPVTSASAVEGADSGAAVPPTTAGGAGAVSRAAVSGASAPAAATPTPASAEWGCLASELEAFLLQAGSRLAAPAAAAPAAAAPAAAATMAAAVPAAAATMAAAAAAAPTAAATAVAAAAAAAAATTAAAAGAAAARPVPSESRRVASCLAYVAVLCREAQAQGPPLGAPGPPMEAQGPPLEARILGLQPHRLAAAACKLLFAWRGPAMGAVRGDSPAASAAKGGSPAATATTEGGRSPPAASAAVDSTSEASGGASAGGAAAEQGVAPSQAPARAAPKGRPPHVVLTHMTALALARMAAHSPDLASRVACWLRPPAAAEEGGARGDGGGGGGSGGGGGDPTGCCDGCGGAGDPGPGRRFQQAAVALLEQYAATQQGTQPEPPPPESASAPGQDVGPQAAEEEAAAAAAVLAAPLPPLLAAPPAGRVLTQLLVCGCPGCGSFGGRSEAELPLKRCGGCKAVRYCGAGCQRAHWPAHRPECGAMAAAVRRARGKEKGAGGARGDCPSVW